MPSDHQDSHHSTYSQNGWMGVPGGYASPPTTMSPMHEFPPFEYHQSTPVPMEPAYTMARPAPYPATHAQMPPPLIMPHSGLWPSMLASQPHPNYQTPILPAGPIQTPISASTASDMTPTSAKTSSSRRKLTDDERRQMCIEAEQNPTMKQTQIGAKFNVERSTVSKILRQREKYMNPQPKEETTSPGKKSKAKLPDFEKTLTNWVRNQQKKGLPITDEDLRKQAQVFSFSRSDQAVLSSESWLEKFKLKNQLTSPGGGTKSERERAALDSSATSRTETPVDGSPQSSGGLVSPPMSAIDEIGAEELMKNEETPEYFDFDDPKQAFDSAMELQGRFVDEDASGLSPLSPELNRAEQTQMSNLSIGEGITDAAGNPGRYRSQTYSHGQADVTHSRPASAQKPLPVRSLTSAVDPRPTAIDPRQMMKRHKSVPDIHYPEQVRFSPMPPPPLPKSADTSPISNPATPAEDDNIKALHQIKALLEQNPAVAEPDDYLAIGKLMQKLKLLRPTAVPLLPGGMHPIDILDSPRISKKRTILGIST